MVSFLTKPFQKMSKNNRAKGVALKTPDIKIIMYVCTPLNKVFGFQGSNQILGGRNCFSIPLLFEPFLKPFLRPSRLFELEPVNSKPKSCLKSSGVERNQQGSNGRFPY